MDKNLKTEQDKADKIDQDRPDQRKQEKNEHSRIAEEEYSWVKNDHEDRVDRASYRNYYNVDFGKNYVETFCV